MTTTSNPPDARAGTRSPKASPEITELVETVARGLEQGESVWARTSLGERRALLRRFHRLTARHAQTWIDLARQIKSIPEGSAMTGEEWTSGPWALLNYARALDETLGALDNREDVLAGFATRTAPGGRPAIRVLPHTLDDRLLLTGYSAEVWLKPGTALARAGADAGLGQREPARTRGACLVLGAGNILSITALDVLYALYADNRVVVLKLNPVSDALRPALEKIFAPYLEIGAVQIVSGGAEVGSALAQHEAVDAVHLTGSEATHDAIVWGTGQQATDHRKAGTPALDKPVSSELGGVSPVIVVPGRWSRADLRHQAEHVATMRLHNTGANCVAAQVVLLSADWAQKEEFLDELRQAMVQAPARPSWYPGSGDRARAARAAYPAAEAVGGTPERTLLLGIPAQDGGPAFSDEYFGPVLGVSELPGHGADFLEAAVRTANEELRGTLGANIIVDPRTRRSMGATFEELVAELRYGTIGINVWTAVGYLTPHATWGAFPGHTLDDVQSGIGVVHNALLLADTERTVVTGPWRPPVKPPWFVSNRTADRTGELLTRYTGKRDLRLLPKILASALRG